MKHYERMIQVVKKRRSYYEKGLKVLDKVLAIHENEEIPQEEKAHKVMLPLMRMAILLEEEENTAVGKELDE